jgi:hypothetical protein
MVIVGNTMSFEGYWRGECRRVNYFVDGAE